MCTDGWSDMIDQKVFNAKSLFNKFCDKLGILSGISVRNEHDVVFVTPCTNLFFHTVNEGNQ